MNNLFLLLIFTVQLSTLFADWRGNGDRRDDDTEFLIQPYYTESEDGDSYEESGYNYRQVVARRVETKTVCCDNICCQIREKPPSDYYYMVNNKQNNFVMNATCVNCWMARRPKISVSNEPYIVKKQLNTREEYHLHRGCKACRC